MNSKSFVRGAAVFGALLVAWNCNEDSTLNKTEIPGISSSSAAVPGSDIIIAAAPDVSCAVIIAGGTPVFHLTMSNGASVIISPIDYSVMNGQGIKVGSYNATTKELLDINGNVLIQNLNVSSLATISNVDCSYSTPNGTVIAPITASSSSTATVTPITSSSSSATSVVTPQSSAAVIVPQSSATVTPPKSSSSAASQTTGSSDSNKCFDDISGKTVNMYATIVTSTGKQYAYHENCKLVVYYDPNPGGTSQAAQSSAATVKSSSSKTTIASSSSRAVVVSSSSKAVSSSSKAVSSSSKATSGTSPTFTPVAGGASGSGWASRYWDSCKPHCAWSGKGATISKTCHADGSAAGVDEASVCDGGTAGTCTSQIPIVINDNLAYAYAATPAGGNDCGKCYLLTFTGTGKYSSDANQQKLKGKQMVVMATNIGGDVGSGQFDIMIPGGGVGAYNGCSKMGLSCSGAQYGGLLSDCETSSNYNASTYKSCLINKCNTEYASNAQAKQGCLFLANWMEAAGNPNLTYVQVNCPQELVNNY